MSMHTLFETQVKIGLSDTDFKKGIATAGTMVKDFASSGIKALGSLTGSFASLTKDVASSVKELAVYGDHIDKQSQKMNMSAKAYQEWDAILKHSGTSIDSMQASMKTLATAVESGDDAFERLGLSLEEAQSLNGEELFSRTITALQNVEDDTKRTYLAGQLLGKGATELGALLNTSAEDTEKMRQRVHELNGVMGDEAVKASAAFQDSLQDMQTVMSGLKRTIGSELLPSFTLVMDGITEVFAGEEGGENKIEKGINQAFEGIGRSAAKLKPIISKLGNSIFKVIQSNLPQIVSNGIQFTTNIATEIISALPQILRDAGGIISTIGETLTENIPQLADAAKKAITGFSGYLRENLPQLIPQGMQAVSELVKGLTSPEVSGTLINAAFDVVSGLIDGLTSSETINAIMDGAPVIVENIATGIVNAADKLADAALQLCSSLFDYFGNEENRQKLYACGEKILDTIANSFESLLGTGAGAIYNLGGLIAENIGLGDYWQVGNDVLAEWWAGFSEKWEDFKKWWKEQFLFISSPINSDTLFKSALDSLTGGKYSGSGSHSGSAHERGAAQPSIDYSQLEVLPPYSESALPNEYKSKHGDLEARKRTSYHARGAIIDYPLTTHVFGESGREAVLPLDTNTGWMDKLVDKINNQRSITLNIYHTGTLNDETDWDFVIDKIDQKLEEKRVFENRSIGVVQ